MLKVCTYNIAGNAGSAIETIREIDPDVICVNEVYEGALQVIAEELDMYYYFGQSHGSFGNGLLSRFPIKSSQNIILSDKENDHPRSVIIAEILLEFESDKHESITSQLNLIITHLDHRYERIRKQQIKEIVYIIEEWKKQTNSKEHLLMGDLNSLSKTDYTEQQWQDIINLRLEKGWTQEGLEPITEVVQFLESKSYEDCWKSFGDPNQSFFTVWPKRPIMRIDYIFKSKEFNYPISSCYRFENTNSDHWPVVIEMDVTPMCNK